MQIQFIGATGTVTGSKYLLQTEGKRILIDCGLFQGLKVLRQRNWSALPFDPRNIDAVVLTHAHLDHSGYLPLLIKKGFRGKIYSTRGTRALCGILLPDSGHLQEEDARFLNKHSLSKHKPALPLYTEKDAIKTLDYFHEVSWEEKINLAPHLKFQFIPAGHIVGASMIRFVSAKTRLTFTGDLGRPHGILMKAPDPLPISDYLVVESTYGDRTHPSEDTIARMQGLLAPALKRGGIVLIPAFAVGRVQEVLHLIHVLIQKKKIPNVPVFLNSPMSVKATGIYCDFHEEHRLSPEACQDICRLTHFVDSVEESKRLNLRTDPCIIISASGMATGGRILHHLKAFAPKEKNLILLAGFQAPGTRGWSLASGSPFLKIHGENIPVRAQVGSIDSLSAHADSDEIISWLKAGKKPKETFITHGEPLAAEALRVRIKNELGWKCRVPDYLESFEL